MVPSVNNSLEKSKIIISTALQRLWLYTEQGYFWFAISSSRYGIGVQENSFCTPTGNFVISEKIGIGEVIYREFKGRQPRAICDITKQQSGDSILSRILWLDGCDEHNKNTKSRYIYLHGTNQEKLIGKAVSQGCIRMKNSDIIKLFDLVVVQTPVIIY